MILTGMFVQVRILCMRSIRSSEGDMCCCVLDGEDVAQLRMSEVLHEAFGHGNSEFVGFT